MRKKNLLSICQRVNDKNNDIVHKKQHDGWSKLLYTMVSLAWVACGGASVRTC